MDIARPSQAKAKLRKRIILGTVGLLVLGGVTFALARLKPAAPTVERNLVWIGDVKRGAMVREVRGLGTLVPEDITWIAARTQGRVTKIILRPGAPVTSDSVILVLPNPDAEQAVLTAESQLKAAEADLVSLKVQLERDLLAAEASAAGFKADHEVAKLNAKVNEELFKEGLMSELQLRLSKVNAEQAETRFTIEQKRFAFSKDSIVPQVASKQASVDQYRAQAKLRHDEAEALNVRAGMDGVLQLLPVDIGQQVQPGANLARVADPTHLKAMIQIAETQARDVQIGELARIDTRNGVVDGKVSRIDPSVQNGTVTVDVVLTGPLPRGARPDLSVDGTIELERLGDVVFVGRPAFGQERSTVGMFVLDTQGVFATRLPVELGRTSVNTVEIVKGLQPGDRVILSDMSQWDSHDRIKLN